MLINYTLVIVAVISQFILGALWYSPLLFGKKWMQIMGGDQYTPEEVKKMQKEMTPFYALQILLTLLSTFVLAFSFELLSEYNLYMTALFIFVGFILPTQVSGVIWSNTKKHFWAKQIAIMAGCQFVSLMLATWILSL
jgi:hypothetical protein